MIRIGNGKVITRDPQNPFIEAGSVVVEGNRIIAVGEDAQMAAQYPLASVTDAEGMLIMPGLINAHEHIYSAFARGGVLPFTPPGGFLEVLEGTWWKLDNHLKLDHSYYSAVMSYLECIRNGVTFVSDHHASYGQTRGSLAQIAKAASQLGVRTCLSYEISERNGMTARDEAIEENMEFLDYVSKRQDSMIKGMIGLHASFTLSDETLQICQRENTENAGYHVHIAEGEYDALHCQMKHGMSVVERFSGYGILHTKSVAGHCIHISESDRKILKNTDTMVVHNPQSNMGNAVGAPDVIAMLDEGILTGLGTDGYTHDMLESLKTANILQKHRRQRPDRGFSEACELLFTNNAKIAERIVGEPIGILKKGSLADIIVVDYDPPTPLIGENINGHLMFGVNGAMTDSVMVNGNFLMKNRRITIADEKILRQECRKSADDFWKELKK